MINLLKKIFPNLAPSTHIILGYCYDINKFLKTTTNFNPNKDKNKLSALLTRQFHGIEKALTLPNPRQGFGVKLLEALIINTTTYYKNYGYDQLVQTVLDNLVAYKLFHENYSDDSIIAILDKINAILYEIKEYDLSSEKNDVRKIIFKENFEDQMNSFDFKKFTESRVSVRDFAKGNVSLEKIKKGIEVAMNTPSACNRQPWKVRIYKGDKKDFILKYQNGNRGFTDSIDTVLLVTGLTSCFSYSERHGAWVDGGLFSMSLIYALHGLKIGVCALNTSYTYKDEKSLRKAIELPINEEPIMMLALGELKDEFYVTKSTRKSIDQVLVID